MDTIRILIIKEWKERARVIVTTSPIEYSRNLGAKTPLLYRPVIAPAETPCVVLWSKDETSEKKYGKQYNSMVLHVEGIDFFLNREPLEVGEEILGDLIKCYSSPEWNRRTGSPPKNDYIESISYIKGGVYPISDGDKTVGAYADFIVTYYTKVGNPYEQ